MTPLGSFSFLCLRLLFLVDRVGLRDRIVFLELELAFNRLAVLARIIGVAFADALLVSDGDELDEVVL